LMTVASEEELGLFIRAVDDYGAEVPVRFASDWRPPTCNSE
jgi:hypothetical protein